MIWWVVLAVDLAVIDACWWTWWYLRNTLTASGRACQPGLVGQDDGLDPVP